MSSDKLFEPLYAFFSTLLPPSLRGKWCSQGGRIATAARVDSGEQIDVFFGAYGKEDELIRRLRLIGYEVHDYSWIEASLSAGVRGDPRAFRFSVLDEIEDPAPQRHFQFPAQPVPPEPEHRDEYKPSKLSQVTFPASSSSGGGSEPSPTTSAANIERGGAYIYESNEAEMFERTSRAGNSVRRERDSGPHAGWEDEEEVLGGEGRAQAAYADDSGSFDSSIDLASPSRARRSPSPSSDPPNWIDIAETSPPPAHRAPHADIPGPHADIPGTALIRSMEEIRKTVKLEEEDDAVPVTTIPAPPTPVLTTSPFFSSLFLLGTSPPTISISSLFASLHKVLPGDEGDREELQKAFVHLKKGEGGFDARRKKKGP